jgi:hypothetical protein
MSQQAAIHFLRTKISASQRRMQMILIRIENIQSVLRSDSSELEKEAALYDMPDLIQELDSIPTRIEECKSEIARLDQMLPRAVCAV